MSAYLTYQERLEIEAGLKEHRTFGEIGRNMGKDRTTIAKEIKRNALEKKTGVPGYPYNACIRQAMPRARQKLRHPMLEVEYFPMKKSC